MDYLFLDPKVLNYSADRYELILYTMRWARAMKAKGSPDPMPVLIERALKDIVEGRVTLPEILANKIAEAPKEDVPAVVSVADDGAAEAKIAALSLDDDDEKKKTKKKKKKEEE